MSDLRDWIGREETRHDTIALDRVHAMQATLDEEASIAEGDPLPPLWHWLFFNGAARQSRLGPDGHPERGGFMPPVPLPRRMWAGGRFRFERPLIVGRPAVRRSRILDVANKTGRSGELCFVTVLHTLEQEGRCFEEEHDIVYRAMPDGPSAVPVIPLDHRVAVRSRTVTPSPTLLFRYSALTFNGHRIHYDRDYAMRTEHYPGLVFHGPLTATLLAGLAPPDMARFDYRARAPLFDGEPFTIHTDGASRCWALTSAGGLAFEASYEG